MTLPINDGVGGEEGPDVVGGGTGELNRGQQAGQRNLLLREPCPDLDTNMFVFARAMFMVDLYLASIVLKSFISPWRYLYVSQSRMLDRDPVECFIHQAISSLYSLSRADHVGDP